MSGTDRWLAPGSLALLVLVVVLVTVGTIQAIVGVLVAAGVVLLLAGVGFRLRDARRQNPREPGREAPRPGRQRAYIRQIVAAVGGLVTYLAFYLPLAYTFRVTPWIALVAALGISLVVAVLLLVFGQDIA